jgi:hypothetical protein
MALAGQSVSSKCPFTCTELFPRGPTEHQTILHQSRKVSRRKRTDLHLRSFTVSAKGLTKRYWVPAVSSETNRSHCPLIAASLRFALYGSRPSHFPVTVKHGFFLHNQMRGTVFERPADRLCASCKVRAIRRLEWRVRSHHTSSS